jgi:FlaA1/EpsC-like NDP-sugar epimerase
VVQAFTSQIERVGPITVTHPDVERYFMLIPEACQLVLQAASLGADGDVMVLDMGEQVKIVDVAHTLLQMSGRRDVDVVFTGLRTGEKHAEELFSNDEAPVPTDHPLVARVQVPALPAADVSTSTPVSDEAVRAWMRAASSSALGRSGVVEAAEALLGGA